MIGEIETSLEGCGKEALGLSGEEGDGGVAGGGRTVEEEVVDADGGSGSWEGGAFVRAFE